jgi:RNA polymerase sigma factor (sigma-70 family)
MEIMLKDLEKIIIEKNFSDEEYKEFLEKYNNLVIPISEKRIIEKSENNYHSEGIAADYLEEISTHLPLDEEGIIKALDRRNEEDVEELTKTFMTKVAQMAFTYFKAGIDYVELLQEGNIGVLKAISQYDFKNDRTFSNYVDFWIVREMVLYLKLSLETIKNSYKAFLKTRKEQIQNSENSLEELSEEDTLQDEKSVDKKEKILEEEIILESLPYKLSEEEEEILKLYYGLESDNRRYSIYEIEQKLDFSKDTGEEKFYRALEKLSSSGGRMFSL